MLKMLFFLMIVSGSIAFVQAAEPDPEKMSFKGFLWPNQTPGECPFEQSEDFTGLYFAGIPFTRPGPQTATYIRLIPMDSRMEWLAGRGTRQKPPAMLS